MQELKKNLVAYLKRYLDEKNGSLATIPWIGQIHGESMFVLYGHAHVNR